MTINEKDRLDLRQELEKVFSNPRFADIAMEAMPPIDYAQLATKRDLDAVRTELRGEFSELRGEFAALVARVEGGHAELRGELKADMATNVRLLMAGQLATMVMLGGWVAAVT